MGLYMRAVLREWRGRPFADLAEFVRRQRGGFRAVPLDGRGWSEFEVLNGAGDTVLAADLSEGDAAREELDELTDFLADHEGAAAADEAVRSHLASAVAIVGMQVLPSRYDDSVAAANLVIDFLEQQPGVLTQVDTVGWYDGDSNLVLRERA